MRFYFLFSCFLFLSSYGFAQNQITLQGEVLNDTIDKSNLNIVNITSKKGTTTTNSGFFTIRVSIGDTINISSVQYVSRQFVVSETVFKRQKISLYLEPKITELQEVEISNLKLTGDIIKDVTRSKLRKEILPRDLGIPENTAPERTVEERRYYTAVTSSAGIPLDGLINAITGRLKMLKKHVEASRFEKKVQDVRFEFADSIYIKELKIPQERIEDFVYFVFEYEEAEKLVNNENVLGLLEFMMKKSFEYLKLVEDQN